MKSMMMVLVMMVMVMVVMLVVMMDELEDPVERERKARGKSLTKISLFNQLRNCWQKTMD